MKISKYAIVFALIFLAAYMIFQFKVNKYTTVTQKKAEYNYAVDNALDSAVEGIVESADGSTVTVDKQECVDNFYKSLYASFGAMDSQTAQQMLKLYTPVLAIADIDYLQVYYSDEVNGDMQKVWSQNIPYSRHFVEGDLGFPSGAVGYTVNFSLYDDITIVIDGDSSTIYKGRYNELQEAYKDNKEARYSKLRTVLQGEVLGSPGHFELWRSQVVTDTIIDRLSYYVNRHNRIASAFGEQFTFQLPVTAESDIARNISGVSFMCFLQGYPYGAGTSEVYSNFEVSGAHIIKSSGYYTQEVDGYLYYHKRNCTHGTGKKNWYSTKEECAWQGANPCPYCNP